MKAINIINTELEKTIMASLPDIDSDVPTSKKEACIEYIRDRYGYDRVSKIGTIGSYQYKQILKDLLKIEGATPAKAEFITKKFTSDSDSDWDTVMYEILSTPELRVDFEPYHQVLCDMESIMGSARQVGIHACGLVLAPNYIDSVHDLVPVRKTEDGLITDFESSELESVGMVKMDILGLSELDLYGDIVKKLNEESVDVDIYNLNEDDEKTYNTFCEGRTTNVFQFGGSLKSYSKVMLPKTMDDLAAANSLVRPGPLENGWHMDYAKRKNGREDVSFIKGLEKVTSSTYGLLVYQEQIMQTFVTLAGFSMSEADSVRKAMGKKDMDLINSYKEKFIIGSTKLGYDESTMTELFDSMASFAKYAFNRCVSGKEKVKRVGYTNRGVEPTIEEMYNIRNDYNYAKSIEKISLHKKYKKNGYGSCFSLDKNNRLVRNKIVDIRFEGVRDVYKLTTSSGKSIRVTDNHKFPTKRGKKMLSDIKVGIDKIPVNLGYEICKNKYDFGVGLGTNYPPKGHCGFVKKENPVSKIYDDYILSKKENNEPCEICGVIHNRMEMHHIDGDRNNNRKDNLKWLCPSCHKKAHYEMGRVKAGSKGWISGWETVISIVLDGVENVYDVEVSGDVSHTFVTSNDIVTCNSHAVSYSKTAYCGAYLKTNYPLQFWTTSLDLIKDNKDIPVYIDEIIADKNITLAAPDINGSSDRFTCDTKKNIIFWSFTQIKQIGDSNIKVVIEDRQKNGKYYSLEEFVQRCQADKRVVEHLIICGAFDDIEFVKSPKERKRLIEDFRNLRGIKLKGEDLKKDWFLNNSANLDNDYWWLIKQKELCGYSVIHYPSIIRDKYPHIFDIFKYRSVEDILSMSRLSGTPEVVVAGLVYDVKVRKIKDKEIMSFKLENNYRKISITIWSEEYKKFQEQLLQVDKKIIIFVGEITWSNFDSSNSLRFCKNTKIQIL